LEINLSDEDMEELEKAVPFDPGFPHTFIGGYTPGEVKMLQRAGHYDFVDPPKAIVYKP